MCFFYTRVRVPWLRSGASAQDTRKGRCYKQASRCTASSTSAGSLASGVLRAVAGGLRDPVERARVTGAGAAPEGQDGAGRVQRVVARLTLRKKIRSRAAGGRTRGKPRGRCRRRSRSACRRPPDPAEENKVGGDGEGGHGAQTKRTLLKTSALSTSLPAPPKRV